MNICIISFILYPNLNNIILKASKTIIIWKSTFDRQGSPISTTTTHSRTIYASKLPNLIAF